MKKILSVLLLISILFCYIGCSEQPDKSIDGNHNTT